MINGDVQGRCEECSIRENVLEASVRKVWSESRKYYSDSITKAMVKGFCSGSVPSLGSTISQIVTDKREKNECVYS